MTGSEHRHALPFLLFSVVGVAGAPGNGDHHSALTAAICELVFVTNALFAAKCNNKGGGILYSMEVVLAKKAHAWVVDIFQPVLGPVNTTKLHRMWAHLLEESRLRGNVGDCNSAYNEALHKAVKAAYKLTNKRRDQFVEQPVLSEQVYTLLHDEGKDNADAKEKGPGTDKDDYVSAGSRRSRPQRRQRRRRWYVKKYSLVELARSHSIPGLPAVLCRPESTLLCRRGNLSYGDASQPRRRRAQHTIRAAPGFHGSSWFDWLRYRRPDGAIRVGQAALVVTTRARGWERLVVRPAEKATAKPGCVLNKYGCERLQRNMEAEGDAVHLDVLTTADIVSWIAVEYDWEDLSERHGVTVMPDDVLKPAKERRASRFFVNAFVVREGLGECASESVDGSE